MTIEDSPYIKSILEGVRNGEATLFIGAGCSISSNAPSTEELKKKLKKAFPLIEQKDRDLFLICQDIQDTPPYTKEKLKGFITEQFQYLEPSESFLRIPKFDWRAIFTTNYDDLIEQSFRKPEYRRKHIVIKNSSPRSSSTEGGVTPIYKIMGSFDASRDEDGPVLTRFDYDHSLRYENEIFEHLIDILKGGPLIFIGYSASDNFGFDALDEALEKYGNGNISNCFAIMPDLPKNITEETRLRKRNIIPIKGTFEEFMQYLVNNIDAVPVTSSNHSYSSLTIRGKKLLIEDSFVESNENFYEILTDEKINFESGKMDDFFKGVNSSWSAFKENWDFQREIYAKVRERVITELNLFEPENNEYILIEGSPGTGKTVLLRRLCYDIYSSGIAPVVYLGGDRSEIKLELLDNLILEINRISDKTGPKNISAPNIKLMLVIDGSISPQYSPSSLKNYFSSRSKSCLIVQSLRDSDAEDVLSWDASKLKGDKVFRLQESLGGVESEKLGQKLVKLGYVDSLIEYQRISQSNGFSFFGTIYSSVDPSKRPLNKIITDQFEALSQEAKEMFLHVCSFSQYGISINLELLVRSLGGSYTKFFDLIEEKAVKDVLVEIEPIEGDSIYSSHHRIISERTIRYFVGSESALLSILSQILSDVNFSNQLERNLVEKLMVHHLGARGDDFKLSLRNRDTLFSLVCDQVKTKTMLHHWGKIKQEIGEFDEAEKLMKNAIALKESYGWIRRSESNRNILVSLGSLYAQMAIKESENGDKVASDKHFAQSLQSFNSASNMDLTNPYPYHGAASMYRSQAWKEKDSVKKISLLSKAIDFLNIGIDNVNPEDSYALLRMQLQIYGELGNESEVTGLVSKITKETHGADAYRVLCNYFLNNAKAIKDKGQPYNVIAEAYAKAEKWNEEGLSKFPSDESLLVSKIKIINFFRPNDHKLLLETLKKWRASAERLNFELLFSLGVELFIGDDIPESRKIFKELDRKSEGLRTRMESRYTILDDHSNLKLFHGHISRLYDEYNGEIQAWDLGKGSNFHFRPYAPKLNWVEGQNVTFNISFNYRGAIATNVRRA